MEWKEVAPIPRTLTPLPRWIGFLIKFVYWVMNSGSDHPHRSHFKDKNKRVT